MSGRVKGKKHNSFSLASNLIVIFVFPRKSVCFSEQIMSADKWQCIFSRQMAAIVYFFTAWGGGRYSILALPVP